MKTIHTVINTTAINTATIQSTLIASLIAGLALPISPAMAQVSADVLKTAQDSCVTNAQSKGFQLQNVVESGASDRPDQDAKIVLNLARDGQLFKQTCYYSQTSGVVFGDDLADAAAVVPGASPLWWLLLPLLGLPLLWWAGKHNSAAGRLAGDRSPAPIQAEAIARNNGQTVTIHSGPSPHDRAIGTLSDGQQVTLSGQYQNDWAELADGGWVSTHQLAQVVLR